MIYFIEAVGADAVKVGYTSAESKGKYGLRGVAARLDGLRTGCPFPLRLLHTIEGDFKLERKLHRKWADHRLEGEWFRLSAIACEIASTGDFVETSTVCAGCGKAMGHKVTVGEARKCMQCMVAAREAREAELKCKDCGAQLRIGHRKPNWKGRCHTCAQRNRRITARACARCPVVGSMVRKYGGKGAGGVWLCEPCITVVREERAMVRRAKASEAMQGNTNALKIVGYSARGLPLAA